MLNSNRNLKESSILHVKTLHGKDELIFGAIKLKTIRTDTMM